MEKTGVEQLSAAALDVMRTGAVITAPSGAVLAANAVTCEAFGVSEAELIGRDNSDPLWQVTDAHGRLLEGDEHPATKVARTGEPVVDFLMGLHNARGREMWISLDSLPLRDDAGELIGVATFFRDVTDEQLTERRLERSESQLDAARCAGGIGLFEWDPAQCQLWCDDGFVEVMGGHVPRDLDEWIALVVAADRDALADELALEHTHGPAGGLHHEFFDLNGRRRWFRVQAAVRQVDPADRCDAIGAGDHTAAPHPVITGSVVDTTELSRTNERVTELLDRMTDGYFTLDEDWRIISINRHAEQLLERSHGELVGQDLREVYSAVQGPRSQYAFAAALRGESVRVEAYFEPIARWLDIRVHPIAEGVAVYFRDVSEHHRALDERDRLLHDAVAAQSRLEHAATHDGLTRLLNRASLVEWLEDRLERKGVDDDGTRVGSIAVLFLDLDRFKLVNDTFGHSQGDVLLSHVASRLVQVTRPGDAVARLGGDEFVIAFDGADFHQAHSLAERVLMALREPFEVGGRSLVVTASIGIAFSGGDENAETLLRDADAALYEAKDRGRNRTAAFDDDVRREVVAKLDIESELRDALDRHELIAHYQPIYDSRSGEPVAAEALVRWRHPRRGMLAAGEFVPVAEDSGLIVPIGERMLDIAIDDLSAMRRVLGSPGLVVWVNVSVRQLEEPGFADRFVARMRGLDLLGQIGIEVTETGLAADEDQTVSVLRSLGTSGVPLAIDDFGTGYSSLARLMDFPADLVKIDQSFVRGLFTRDTAPAISAIVELASAMGAKSCAEGIETPEQLECMLALGVELLSGHQLGRPVPLPALGAASAEPRRLLRHVAGRPRMRPPLGMT